MLRDLRTNQALFQELARTADAATVHSVEQSIQAFRDGTQYEYAGADVLPLYETLFHVAQAEGVPVKMYDDVPPWAGLPGSAGGWIDVHKATGKVAEIGIVTASSLPVQARCLLHELGHLFTENITQYSQGDAEIIAEAAAYIVGSQLDFVGLDSSANYVVNWSRNGPFDLKLHPERIRQLESQILDTAARLGRAIEKQYSRSRRYEQVAASQYKQAA